ncbi:GNAT family N-acetyltransferase [Actinospica durhamensis]|uniref:GNAT family N-acetyltransferase n=1 Tax=Actinospica durhamensis TaxID=1508375 RepID=A0A941ESF8_9ACTN|nr:GNAT family N-acetyltransferase [Actinospica durhamensis]MBR7836333.1 GNAT family N-acetyltransferase [Actinospica durhamensis]
MPQPQLNVCPLTPADMDRFLELDNIAFLEGPVTPEMADWQRGFLETDRSIGLFDRDEQVGGASIFTLGLTVPEGRRVPMAGVTWVSVLPTHRRRGGLRAMMRQQLDTLHETGAEPVAGLTASEASIYARFGYGRASSAVTLSVPRHANALRLPPGTDEVSLRLVEPSSITAFRRELYERQALTRPGILTKPEWWFGFDVADTPEMRGGESKLRCVLAERGGTPVGFSLYRTEVNSRQTRVRQVQADDIAAYAALWQMLLNIDLVRETHTVYMGLPVDDPLLLLLEDVRSAAPTIQDKLHIRLVDLDRALAARTYRTPIDVVLEVADAFCPWNAGRWRLTGDGTGAECARTDAPADLTVDVRELGAAYLGGTTLRALESAALVTEHTKGAVRAASTAFASDVQPWLSIGI